MELSQKLLLLLVPPLKSSSTLSMNTVPTSELSPFFLYLHQTSVFDLFLMFCFLGFAYFRVILDSECVYTRDGLYNMVKTRAFCADLLLLILMK